MPAAPRTLRPGLLLLGLLLVAANLRAALTAVGPVLEEIRADLDLSSATASILIALPLVAFAVCSPLMPAIARRIGPERTIGAALIALAGGLVLRSVPVDGAIWVGTALIGAGIAALNVELSEIVKRDFPTRIGQVTGLYSSATAIGAAIAAGLAVPIAGGADSGWRLAIGVWAGLALVALAVWAPQLRRALVAVAGGDPAALGETADSVAAPAQRDEAPGTPPWRSPWRSLLGWQVTAFMGLQSTAYYVLITWLPSIERAAGISPAEAGFHQVLFSASGIIGSLAVSAWISRLRDQRPLVVTGTSLTIIALLGIMLLPAHTWLWASFAGISTGICVVTALSLFGLRTVHHQQAASLSGMAQAVGYLFAATTPIVIGALHDATGGWQVPLLALIGVSVLCMGAGLLAGRARVIG